VTTKTRRPIEKLATLDEQLREAEFAAREVDAQERDAVRRVREAERELAEATVAGKPTAKAEKALAEAKQRSERPWRALRDAAAERVHAARRDHAAFVTKNLEALVADFEPQARETVASIEGTLRDALAGLTRWHQISQELSSLLALVPGLDGSDLPYMPQAYEELTRAISHALAEELPPPLPRSAGPAALKVPPKMRTQNGDGFAPTLVDPAGRVVAL
jgi:hypothetical protein